jgi:predicted nucleic acid-binding protein
LDCIHPATLPPLSALTAMHVNGPVKVVDASALAALLFGEPDAEAIASQLSDARLVAPPLLGFELANVCLIKSRQIPEQGRALIAAFRLRDRIEIEEVAVDHLGILELAATTGLTAFDASYLWLARRLGAKLVTLDKQLAKAEAASPVRMGPSQR